MAPRFIESIWHIRGELALAPGQSSDDAFDRLSPLFQQVNTTHERTDGILTFSKKNQAPQDKMSIFDSGVLTVEQGADGAILRYNLISRALLACFLAPLLFLAIAGATIGLGVFSKPPTAEEKAKAEKAERKLAKTPMNPIDKFLGAPAPDDPDKKKKEEEAKEKAKKGEKGKGKKDDKDKDADKPSPTPAYVFAGIFAALYVVGRVLEARLIRNQFRKRLLDA
ncbi:MAG: hypothetical protein J7485_06000 [Sphingobium sp.]|nr:hypothetical protein [Sphingobium sp.]